MAMQPCSHGQQQCLFQSRGKLVFYVSVFHFKVVAILGSDIKRYIKYYYYYFSRLKVIIEEEKSVSISGADNITIKISYVKFPEHFLGLYFIGSENFSDQVTGLLGMYKMNFVIAS